MITLGGHLLFQAPTVNTGSRLVVDDIAAVLDADLVGELDAPLVGVIDDDVECG